MNILAIESSCDETAAAIVANGCNLLSSKVASQIEQHAPYGGVVPEIASRLHMENLAPLTRVVLSDASLSFDSLNAIAVTVMPGLIGALLTGLNFTKGLALSLKLPLIPVHHLRGHVASLYLSENPPSPPFIALIASGGHSLLCRVHSYTNYQVLGCTHDDAAGECFDKVARVLGLSYPGGAELSRLAASGDPSRYKLPRGIVKDNPLDMSFSGLKTAAVNLLHNASQKQENINLPDFAASFEQAVVDTLAPRLIQAACLTGDKTVVCAGGVAANSRLRDTLTRLCDEADLSLHLAPREFCGDNAAMIAAQAYHEFKAGNFAKMSQNAFANSEI